MTIFVFKVGNEWKTVSHTLVFQSAPKFSDYLKRAQTPHDLITVLFGPNNESLFTKYNIRLLVHEENLDDPTNNKSSRTKMTAQERHFMEEVKRMQNARNFELIVGCEMSYGMDFVFPSQSTADKNECVTQVKQNYFLHQCRSLYPKRYLILIVISLFIHYRCFVLQNPFWTVWRLLNHQACTNLTMAK